MCCENHYMPSNTLALELMVVDIDPIQSIDCCRHMDDDANIVPQPASIPFLEHMLQMEPNLMNGAQLSRMSLVPS
jgi:hypothetical protein